MSKQLLPVYDKPMIYYPLSVLMLAGIRDILIISTPQDLPAFRRLLGDGDELGLRLDYAEQAEPNGLAEAFLIGADHVGDDPAALVLGDNIFHGPGFSGLLQRAIADIGAGDAGCVLFGYPVRDPQRYGVAEADADGPAALDRGEARAPAVEPGGHRALLLRQRRGRASPAACARRRAASWRSPTSTGRTWSAARARLVDLGRGFAWLDTGTHESLLEAGEYVQVLENRQGIRIACIEEIAMRMGFIDPAACYALGERQAKSGYGEYVMDVAKSYRPRV